MSSAELVPADIDDGVLGVELAVGVFEGFLYAPHGLDDVQRTQKVDIHHRSVAYEPHDGGVRAAAHVDIQPQPLYPADEVVHLFFVGIVLDYDYHILFSPCAGAPALPTKKPPLGTAVLTDCSEDMSLLPAHTRKRALKVKARKVKVVSAKRNVFHICLVINIRPRRRVCQRFFTVCRRLVIPAARARSSPRGRRSPARRYLWRRRWSFPWRACRRRPPPPCSCRRA